MRNPPPPKSKKGPLECAKRSLQGPLECTKGPLEFECTKRSTITVCLINDAANIDLDAVDLEDVSKFLLSNRSATGLKYKGSLSTFCMQRTYRTCRIAWLQPCYLYPRASFTGKVDYYNVLPLPVKPPVQEMVLLIEEC